MKLQLSAGSIPRAIASRMCSTFIMNSASGSLCVFAPPNNVQRRLKSELLERIEAKFGIDLSGRPLSMSENKFISQLSDQEMRNKIREAVLECQQSFYFDHGEKQLVVDFFGLSEYQLNSLITSSRQDNRDFRKMSEGYNSDLIAQQQNYSLSDQRHENDQINHVNIHSIQSEPTPIYQTGRTISPNQKEAIIHWFESNRYRTPTLSEINELTKLLKITRRQLYFQMLKLMQKKRVETLVQKEMEVQSVSSQGDAPNIEGKTLQDTTSVKSKSVNHRSIHDSKTILIKARAFIRNWIRTHGRLPTLEEKKHIADELCITLFQLNKQIQLYVNRRGRITWKKRDIIMNALQENEMHISDPDIVKLMNETGLNREQVNYIRTKYIESSSKPGSSRKHIQLWLKSMNEDKIPIDEMMDKAKQFDMTLSQLQQHIAQFQREKHGITAVRKAIIFEWFKENQYKMPTPEEKKHLQAKTQLGPKRLNDFIRSQFSDPSGNLTPEKKETISTYLKTHEYHLLSPVERQELRQLTQLSSTQISQCIIDQLQKPNCISDSARISIHEWIDQTTNRRCPSIKQLKALYLQLPRNHPYQINLCIHAYLRSQKSNSSESNSTLENNRKSQFVDSSNESSTIEMNQSDKMNINQVETLNEAATKMHEIHQFVTTHIDEVNTTLLIEGILNILDQEDSNASKSNFNELILDNDWIHLLQIQSGLPRRKLNVIIKKVKNIMSAK